jgi:site-specific DNA-methyltransferase (adenine-specific)
MLRDLAGVVNREQAEAGVFVCLDAPTKEMKVEAHRAGRVDLPGGDRPKIQIVTVAELISGPDLGISTALDSIAAAEESKREARRQQQAKKKPSPADLRRHPPLPPMPLRGGKRANQVPLDLEEPLLSPQQPLRRSSHR